MVLFAPFVAFSTEPGAPPSPVLCRLSWALANDAIRYHLEWPLSSKVATCTFALVHRTRSGAFSSTSTTARCSAWSANQGRIKAMLFISHDLAMVGQVAGRVAVMRHGQIVETGPVSEVLSNPQHDYTRSLLAAVPTLRTDRNRPLATIGGQSASPPTPASDWL